MRIELETGSFVIDDRFSEQRLDHESGSVWVRWKTLDRQLPIFNFALSEVVDITEAFPAAPGFEDPYEARVRSYFDIKRPGVESSADSVREVGGRTALVRTVEYRRPRPGQDPLHSFGLFVNLRLDDAFCQEFSADCPHDERELYEPLFWEAIHSWVFHGGAREAIDRQEAARADLQAMLAAATERLATRPAPPPDPEPSPAPLDPEQLTVGASIGPATLEIRDSVWSIPSFSGALVVELELVGEPGELAGLPPFDEPDGTVQITLEVTGIHRGGVPTGRVEITHDRGPGHVGRVRLTGLDFGITFSGVVDFLDGWVVLRGRLGRSYELQSTPIEVRVRLDPGELTWPAYRFTDLAELEQVDVEQVRRVQLTELEEGADLACLTRFDRLELLWLRAADWGEPREISVPESVFVPTLRELTLHSIRMPSLPVSLGSLTDLERLTVAVCALQETGEAIWRLPQLCSLSLDRNQLEAVPERVDLPSLRWLDLRSNGLRTLPASLVRQPALERLQLSDNAFETLPEGTARPGRLLDLELSERLRLLDHTYRNVDGEIPPAWDDELFYARSEPSLAAEVDRVFATVEEVSEAERRGMRFLTRRSVGLRRGQPSGRLGAHRLGGLPDLPKGVEHPHFDEDGVRRPYEFLLQLDCADLAPLQPWLPRTGFLYVFLSSFHDLYEGGREDALVLQWYDVGPEALRPGGDLEVDSSLYADLDEPHERLDLQASGIASAPDLYAAASNPHWFRGPAQALTEREDFLDDHLDRLLVEALQARFPFDVGLNTCGFTQHEDPEHAAALTHKGRAEDWVTLVQLPSLGSMQWGDAGDLFVVVHRGDLANRDFRRAYAVIESS